MTKMIVFHSGNPGWQSCTKVIGIARKMKEIFPNKLDLQIHTTNPEAAKGILFRSSTTVLRNDEQVPTNVSRDLSADGLEAYNPSAN